MNYDRLAEISRTLDKGDSRLACLLVDYDLARSDDRNVATFVATLLALRSHYVRALEDEIRRAAKISVRRRSMRVDEDINFVPSSWGGLLREMTSPTEGQGLYRIVVRMLFVGVLGVYIALAIFIDHGLSRWPQAAMIVALFRDLVPSGRCGDQRHERSSRSGR
jgi:hypothetical protein